MHLLVLGATGRTGVYACQYALEQGHHVTAIVRNISAISPRDNLTIVRGSVLSEQDMDSVFRSAQEPIDAVVQCLNTSSLSPPRLMADAAANVARALRQHRSRKDGVLPRLVVMSAIGVGESRKVAPWLSNLLVDYHSGTAMIYKDHNELDEEIEKNCGAEVDWTLALAVGLKNSGRLPVRTFGPQESGASWFISRQSCAEWMVDVAMGMEKDEFKNRRVIVSN
ncbi:hypothetical protein BKA56DRAFT_259889 [Ilyonectria sp. MPI-CAGE-AT-0026]|nr:hypothetical protein BKA56DRAFT_259889 [Ilyonectria sp. MPI-CAGE-AT-0026]